MADQKNTAARRLRMVRHLNGLTQAELGRRSGYSEIYVQKIEGGLGMAEEFAESVAHVTGISFNWLLGRTGKSSAPIDGVGLPYDPRLFENRRRLHADMDRNGFVAGEIHRLCHSLTDALTEAYRKGHYAFISESVRALLTRTCNKLNLRFRDPHSVSPKLERRVFSGDGYSADPAFRESLWRLLSPIGVMKWADALEGTAADRQNVLSEIDSLYELVATSFSEE